MEMGEDGNGELLHLGKLAAGRSLLAASADTKGCLMICRRCIGHVRVRRVIRRVDQTSRFSGIVMEFTA